MMKRAFQETAESPKRGTALVEGEGFLPLCAPAGDFQAEGKAFSLFQKVQGAMSSLPDFTKTCQGMLEAVLEEIDGENCSLMLMDHNSGALTVFMARSKKDFQEKAYVNAGDGGYRFKAGEGVAGWVFQEGFSLVVEDTDAEPRFLKRKNGCPSIKSLSCFPVRVQEEVVGVFNISHSRPRAFGEWEQTALAYVAHQIGAALSSSLFVGRVGKEKGSKFKVLEALCAERQGQAVKDEPDKVGGPEKEVSGFVFYGEKMKGIERIINQIADTDVTVFLQGESGVGKEVIARTIHERSTRRNRPFVKVNCAALPSELLESELFGYEKGAFTGAYRQKPGKFELADGGTIFLDEIAEISPALQAKLLQVLQDGEFSRLGGKKDIKVNVRIISATNKDIREALKTGAFREDFYYRLNIVNITIPPLRQRKEEIPVLIDYFMKKYRKKLNLKREYRLSPQALETLLNYHWPGNIRELENMIQRFLVLGQEAPLLGDTPVTVHPHAFRVPKEPVQIKIWPTLREVNRRAVQDIEKETIKKVLEATCWNRKKAAEMLNISYKTLLSKIRECRIREESAPPFFGGKEEPPFGSEKRNGQYAGNDPI
jgi:transcriptional regulator with GAF, ATPase, and Fis domain